MTGVIRAAGHSVHPLQHSAHVPCLRAVYGIDLTHAHFDKSSSLVLILLIDAYLSGDAKRLESIGTAGDHLCLVDKQHPDVVLTLHLPEQMHMTV